MQLVEQKKSAQRMENTALGVRVGVSDKCEGTKAERTKETTRTSRKQTWETVVRMGTDKVTPG